MIFWYSGDVCYHIYSTDIIGFSQTVSHVSVSNCKIHLEYKFVEYSLHNMGSIAMMIWISIIIVWKKSHFKIINEKWRKQYVID
jgi:hypothetical protein